ncbi:MAG: hypothetical protein ACE367_05805 [Acidimicrobiales bacterium]
MSRIRALALCVVVLALVATGCVGGGSTALSDPAVRPGTPGADEPRSAPEPGASDAEASTGGDTDAADPAAETSAADGSPAEAPAETPPPGGFVLDLPEGSLPTGPPPAGDEGALGGVPVDVAFVQRSLETAAQQSYRFEMRFAMSVDMAGQSLAISPSEPLATGETDGFRQRTLIDLGVMFDAFVGSLGSELGADLGDFGDLTAFFGDDLGIETIVDGTVVYMRAPMLGMLAAFGGDELPGGLAELGDGWGMVDLATVPGVDAADIAALTGAQGGSSPDQILALLEDLGSVDEIGPATIDGDATTHYRTVIDVQAAIEAGVAEFEALGPVDPDDIASMFGDGPVVDLYIDDAGNLRRLSLAITGQEPSGEGSFAASTTIDMFDHGAGITIDVPADAVDLTDVFAELAALTDGPI